ncbi:glycosyl transferase [Endogone sp. FLAS-F59071]|nr:glycosyl transferase [Endogone sp. FLAS-F59071]|eukprot:RUS18838.1 glycosyl transferase [Endogone sp. FLAS-F59071]
MAPAYFVYLLKAYCFQTTATNSDDRPEVSRKCTIRTIRTTTDFQATLQIYPSLQCNPSAPKTSFSILNFVVLGGSVILAFALSFGPFAYLGQMPQVFSRLFPFTRGLCHALWAPNFWALYAGADRVLIIGGRQEARLGAQRGCPRVHDTWIRRRYKLRRAAPCRGDPHAAGDAGRSDDIHVTLQILWRKPTFDNFLSALTLCGFASFLFGWHVHEKAILLVLIPFSLMATNNRENLKIFVILSTAGIYSLYPLLFQVAETPIKLIVTAVWMTVVFAGLAHEMQAYVSFTFVLPYS